MYRRVAFAAAAFALAAGGVLVVWAMLRPHADLQRIYGAALGVVGLSVGAVQLLGAMSMPAAGGQTTWRGLRPWWPVITGVVVIAMVAAGVGMAAELGRILEVVVRRGRDLLEAQSNRAALRGVAWAP